MASYTLLIYELVPEDTVLYLIPNNRLDAEELGFLQQANGKIINRDEENEGMRFINAACADKKEYCDEDAPEDWKCCYSGYRWNNSHPIDDTSITRVILTGFIL